MQSQHIDIGERPALQLSLKEITEILVRKFKVDDGLYDLSIEFQIGVGGVGPNQDLLMPGASIGVSQIGIIKTNVIGPTTVDASIINSKKTKSKKIT